MRCSSCSAKRDGLAAHSDTRTIRGQSAPLLHWTHVIRNSERGLDNSVVMAPSPISPSPRREEVINYRDPIGRATIRLTLIKSESV